MAEEKIPDKIKKFYKLDSKIDNVVKTTAYVHSDVMNKAAETVLPKTSEGVLDWSKLDEKEYQDKLIAELTKGYVSRAKQELHIKGDHTFESEEDEKVYNARLMQQYSGLTEDLLKNLIRKNGSKYTTTAHAEITSQHVEQVEKGLRPTAHQHLEKKDLADIVAHTKSGQFLNHKNMEIEQGANILREYKQKGAVSSEQYKKEIFYKKKAA